MKDYLDQDIGPIVLLVLALELLDEVVDQAVVEVLANGSRPDIEGTTAQVEDQDVALGVDLVDSGSGRLVDDTEDVLAGDGTLVGLTLKNLIRINNYEITTHLRVVEVGQNGDLLAGQTSAISRILVKIMEEVSG